MALFSLSIPVPLYALGLGEMKVLSSLDQPFDAEIQLIDMPDVPLTSIKVNLADPDNFKRNGVEYTPVLSLLDFRIFRAKSGKIIIRVHSTERIVEPYFQMIVDLAWSQGQIYRTYTVLLDPPGYQLVSTRTSHGFYANKTPSHDKEPGIIHKDVISSVSQGAYSIQDAKGMVTYGPTVSNENVWQIAQRYKLGDLILQQVVLAIVGANPEAFVNGNLNGLKVGVKLKIPSTQDMLKIPAELATEEVLAHDKAWNEKTSINHVISPPYMTNQPITLSSYNYQSVIPSIPPLDTKTLPDSVLNSKLIPQSVIMPLVPEKAKSAPNKPSAEHDPTTKAEISITAAAVDSVRESNAALMQQLKLLQEQNKALQAKLDKREKDVDNIQKQLKVMIKQRAAIAGQASAATVPTDSGSLLPLLLLLGIASGGAGTAFWFYKRKEEEMAFQPNTQPQETIHPIIKEEVTTPVAPENNELMPQLMESAVVSALAPTEETTPSNNELIEDSVVSDITEQELTEPVKPKRKKASSKKEPKIEEPASNISVQHDTVNLSAVTEEDAPSSTEVSQAIEEPVLEFQPMETDLSHDLPVKQNETVEQQTKPQASEPTNEENNEDKGVLEFETGLHEKISEPASLPEPTKEETKIDDNLDAIEFVSAVSENKPQLSELLSEKTPITPSDESNELDALEFTFDSPEVSKKEISDEQLEFEKALELNVPEETFEFHSEPNNVVQESSSQNDESENLLSSKLLKSAPALDTLLALAKTYIGMEDYEAAKSSLEEVIAHGTPEQAEEAKKLLAEINSKS